MLIVTLLAFTEVPVICTPCVSPSVAPPPSISSCAQSMVVTQAVASPLVSTLTRTGLRPVTSHAGLMVNAVELQTLLAPVRRPRKCPLM